MTVWIARVSLALALLLGIALGVQTWRLSRQRDATVEARAAVQREQLLAAGWKRAAEVSRAELERIVPTLQAEIAALKKAEATLAGTSHWTGRGRPVPVPCPDPMAPPAGAPTAATPPGRLPDGLPGEPLTVDVTPHVKIDDAIALDDAGGLYVARKVAARLSVGETRVNEWEPVTPDEVTTAIDPRVSEAWRAYQNPPSRVGFVRPPKQWRFGLACGIGLGYGVVARGVDVTAACLYGVQF